MVSPAVLLSLAICDAIAATSGVVIPWDDAVL
jgi:hypothetical protein